MPMPAQCIRDCLQSLKSAVQVTSLNWSQAIQQRLQGT